MIVVPPSELLVDTGTAEGMHSELVRCSIDDKWFFLDGISTTPGSARSGRPGVRLRLKGKIEYFFAVVVSNHMVSRRMSD